MYLLYYIDVSLQLSIFVKRLETCIKRYINVIYSSYYYYLFIVKRFDHIIGKRYISTCYVCMYVCNYKIMIQWRKIISFDFDHIPKLSLGFKTEIHCILQSTAYEELCKNKN